MLNYHNSAKYKLFDHVYLRVTLQIYANFKNFHVYAYKSNAC